MTQDPTFFLRLEVDGSVEYTHPASKKIIKDRVIHLDYKRRVILVDRKDPHRNSELELSFSEIINAYPG
jgi:hypothetical protein